MAKIKIKNMQKKNGPKKARKPTIKRVPKLDNQALAYKHLLEDPCNGPLVHPVYPGSEQGVLMRFTSYVTVNTGGTNDSGSYVYNPSALSAVDFFTVGGNTNGTWSQVNGGIPGYAFFQSQNVRYRTVAACLEAYTNSSEMNRQGQFGFSNTQDALYVAGNVSTAVTQLSTQPYVVRVPDKQIGIRWLPSNPDMDFSSFGPATLSGGVSSLGNSLQFAWTGHQAGVGITLKLTGVYEVVFQTLGVPQSINNNPSSNTITDILHAFWQENKSTIIAVGVEGAKYALNYAVAAIAA